MWSENQPSGRDQAIETLVDKEPQGSFYRASRVLEESVPQALFHRTNLITKSALVEQAHGLAIYEIDQVSKYDAIFGDRNNSAFSDRLVAVPEREKERILRHHAKILATKGGTNKASLAPPPKLVASLRRINGESQPSELRAILKSVLEYPAFSQDDDLVKSDISKKASDETSNARAYQLESLIASVCNTESDSSKLQGLLLSILALVTEFEGEATDGDAPKELSDPTSPPPLQLGSLLSLLRPEESSDNPWMLDPELLSHLGLAASTYEERIEIQKSQLLAKLETPTTKLFDTDDEAFQTPRLSTMISSTPPIGISTPISDTPSNELSEAFESTNVLAVAEEPDSEDEIEAAAAALSAAVFEQIMSAATGGDDSSDDNDSSDSGSDQDSDYEESVRNGMENRSSSSSSSSSSSHGEPGDDRQPRDSEEELGNEAVIGETNDTDTDDDMILRQALALSLVDQTEQETQADDSSSQVNGVQTDNLSADPVTPGTETPTSTPAPSRPVEDEEESPLPPIPPAPMPYPYAKVLDAKMDSDEVSTDSQYFDPSALNRFATIPSQQVLVHLLQYVLECVERRKFFSTNETSGSDSPTAKPATTIVGGMSSVLFPQENRLLSTRSSFTKSSSSIATDLQMLISLLILVVERRDNAIEKYSAAVAGQSGDRASRVEQNTRDGPDIGNASSEEGDDPALALALHYLDEEAGETTDSLEAKGMHRKAAAAAHDAAALQRALKRRTEGWRQQVQLFSYCASLTMKGLKNLLQFIVRRWLHERSGVHPVDCHDFIPKSILSKLSIALLSFQGSIASSMRDTSSLNDVDVMKDRQLFQDSLLLWAETVPLIYPTVQGQTEVLQSYLSELALLDKDTLLSIQEKVTTWPLSKAELLHHRLTVLCRRLRVSDLLNRFVSSPICFLPEDSPDLPRIMDAKTEPTRASSLISKLFSMSRSMSLPAEATNFYFALCHRCHVHILLWDGFYASAEVDPQETALALSTDTIKLGSNPSSSLVFDPTRCSDSMALVSRESDTSSSPGSSVNQRASKVWGTVLSSTSFSPKTGVHRWAVRLDKCERGHVFVGVATSQGSVRTYVGGDKYGWGMIGTQALWHDRRKIRGDYGATFRTGSIIIVTLDSDAGTLSFSSWKDNSSSNAFSLDPVLLGTPKRQGSSGGIVEDWGVAFEGLPLDSKLYPAVGLYQRDDRVTLLTVESRLDSSNKEGTLNTTGAQCYFPASLPNWNESLLSHATAVRKFNESLLADGIDYVSRTLDAIAECASGTIVSSFPPHLLYSLAAALCLLPPSIPRLSKSAAILLLPKLRNCTRELQKARNGVSSNNPLQAGLAQGKWTIRATTSMGHGNDAEEYVVDLRNVQDANGRMKGFEGTGLGTTGRSKNGVVAIVGTVDGSSLQFVEEWTDANGDGYRALSSGESTSSSCVITARLSLDGKKFEGMYRNVQFGTTGKIAGLLVSEESAATSFRRKDAPPSVEKGKTHLQELESGETLLSLAQCHLATVVFEDGASDFGPETSTATSAKGGNINLKLKKCLSMPMIRDSAITSSLAVVMDEFRSNLSFKIRMEEEFGNDLKGIFTDDVAAVLSRPKLSSIHHVDKMKSLLDEVVKLDDQVSPLAGGAGSLSSFCSKEFHRTRRLLITLLVYRSGIEDVLQNQNQSVGLDDDVKVVWRTALRTIEDGVRVAIGQREKSTSVRDAARALCLRYEMATEFLLSLERTNTTDVETSTSNVVEFLNTIESDEDLQALKSECLSSSARAALRLIALQEMQVLLSCPIEDSSPTAIELLVSGLPRMLGRSTALLSGRNEAVETFQGHGLDGHYFMQLPGSGNAFRQSLMESSHLIWSKLCKFAEYWLKRRVTMNSDEKSAVDSLVLSLFSSFAIAVQDEDVKHVLIDAKLFDTIALALDAYRDVALKFNEGMSTKASLDQLQELSEREISKAIVRLLVSVMHTVTYQSLVLLDEEKSNECLKMCCLYLFEEIKKVHKCVQEDSMKIAKNSRAELCDIQWMRWKQSTMAASSNDLKTPRTTASPSEVGRGGVQYLQEYGTMHLRLPSSSQKSPRARVSSSSSKTASPPQREVGEPFSFQAFAELLHIVVAVAKCECAALDSQESNWLALLHDFVGLGGSGATESIKTLENISSLTPARFCARIVRIMYHLYEHRKADDETIKRLFELAGNKSAVLMLRPQQNETQVSNEVISLLRRLHDSDANEWRQLIETNIVELLNIQSSTSAAVQRKIGVLLFLNGGIQGLQRGSYVLLKPDAALPLSVEQQSTSSTKSHSGSSGSQSAGTNSVPHHIVGSGTEGVVAGLCRSQASAGVISSIDVKNGLCEVILLNRNPDKERRNVDSSINNHAKHTLTVRALRSPLSDVVLAQEVDLLIEDFPALCGHLARALEGALDTIDSCRFQPACESKETMADSDAENMDKMSSDVLNVSLAMMVLKSGICLLSDEKLLKSFSAMDSSRAIFSRLLEMAYPSGGTNFQGDDLLDGACQRYLSALPAHEARYIHVLTLFRNLLYRHSVLSETDDEVLERWIEATNRTNSVPALTLVSDPTTARPDDGYTTPPSQGASGSASPPTFAFGNSRVANSSAERTNQTLESGARSASDSTATSERTSGNVDPGARGVSQSTASSDNSDEDEDNEDSEAAATAAADLREAAIAQMAELGLPRSWSEYALRRTGGANIEAAVHFCLERGGEMERLLAEERERERMMDRASSSASSRRRSSQNDASASSHLLRQLMEMGFASRWCAEALAATGSNLDDALTWILANGERLSAEDEGMRSMGVDDEEDDGDEDDEDDDDEDDEDDDDSRGDEGPRHGQASDDVSDRNEAESSRDKEVEGDGSKPEDSWSGSVIPLRFISGRSTIDAKTLAISGLPTGGFSSVGTKGVLLTEGKWYYEAILETAGCLQIGWADGSFAGHCHADRGDGCGDGPSSWAYDGWRRYRWHSTATEWGCRWKEGDVVGCMVDMDNHIISFTLNGRGEEIGMGVAFSGSGFRPVGGVYACVSFNRREKLRLILGGEGSEQFKYPPPAGYVGVGEAVLKAVLERDYFVKKESVLDVYGPLSPGETSPENNNERKFLCDFSDGEHGHELMAWAHRYYGSDASVHLGSGRAKHSSSGQKGSSSLAFSSDMESIEACIGNRLEEVFETEKNVRFEAGAPDNCDVIRGQIEKSYTMSAARLKKQALREILAVSSLLSQKLLIHVLISSGAAFDVDAFMDPQLTNLSSSVRLWKMIELSASLRSSGWVGEAGAMAIAAEALGLGISSNEAANSKHVSSDRGGLVSLSDLDSGMAVPAPGVVQVLSSVQSGRCRYGGIPLSASLAASAEAAIGSGGGGGVLLFLKNALESALCQSSDMRKIVVASIRRSIRLIAVVEYDGEDAAALREKDDDELSLRNTPAKSQSIGNGRDFAMQPDARLSSFLTGLLLSPTVEKAVEDHDEIEIQLFEAWSIGLLSASLPWRMVCALTAAGILSRCPQALNQLVRNSPTLAHFYARLPSTAARRAWAERAASPICSRYVHALIELLASVRHSVGQGGFPQDFMKYWERREVDAATPLPLHEIIGISSSDWERGGGWISCEKSWRVLRGSVEIYVDEWKAPAPSAVRTLMDGGDGPPMLREGCIVMRGIDWSQGNNKNEDGKDQYEEEKKKRQVEKKALESNEETSDPTEGQNDEPNGRTNEASKVGVSHKEDSAVEGQEGQESLATSKETEKNKKKRKKIPNPKLPTGTVLSVEPWDGVPAMARRVKWDLTGEEGVYRYGGGGGRYDIAHVEVNDKSTRVRKRYPFPESAEQCAARHGFGARKVYHIILRLSTASLKKDEHGSKVYQGIMEWPDFGAGVLVEYKMNTDGSVKVVEKELVFGSKDSGWEARFGGPIFVPGTEFALHAESSELGDQAELDLKSPWSSLYDTLVSESRFIAPIIRNREDGKQLTVVSKMRLVHGRDFDEKDLPEDSRQSYEPYMPPLTFDHTYHASSLDLSRDGRTVTCVSPEGRGTAFASVGFTKGVHYWEVKLEQADIGSVFIGVAEKPTGGSSSSYGHDARPRLNGWHGWGFVNFRATYTGGAERIYGAHCHAGDTVGVLLDCDAGRISFFFDGLKYGEHILNDLGCAFDNLSPFGFNVDGCGSGGAGQGAPSGIDGGRSGRYPAQGSVRPKALWPVIGLRTHGDRVTFSSKWNTSYSIDGFSVVKNALAVEDILHHYEGLNKGNKTIHELPKWLLLNAYDEYSRWLDEKSTQSETRGSGPFSSTTPGLCLELDTTPFACAYACALLGLHRVLLPGDRVKLKRSAGRILELAEEAVVLGAQGGRLYYRIISQKSEGGSLTEGGGRAWCFDESEVVDGLEAIEKGLADDIILPTIERFCCLAKGGLRIVYEGGAVVRSDLEIFDGSINLGSIPKGTCIPRENVKERRVNSCGVVRYRIVHGDLEGWISSRIRGGKEEAIVEVVHKVDGEVEAESKSYRTALDSAKEWIRAFEGKAQNRSTAATSWEDFRCHSLEDFENQLKNGIIEGISIPESDAFMASLLDRLSDICAGGDPLKSSFKDIESAIQFAIAAQKGTPIQIEGMTTRTNGTNEVATAMVLSLKGTLPDARACMARMALLRAFNRRAKAALPWLPLRPCQEGSAIFGGVCGHGASVNRAGRHSVSFVDTWVQVPSIASGIRSLRGLFFGSVKMNLLRSITDASTTPTPLSHDEYELPREIRTVRLNRLKARRVMASQDSSAKRKHGVFAQLYNETKSWGGAALRRGFVAKGHGGQKRAFKVKLIGEGVNDYSGPYREAFTDAIAEVLDVSESTYGSLGVLDPTANNVADMGENRDLFMFSLNGRSLVDFDRESPPTDEERRIMESFASLTMVRDESSREVEELLVFLGRLTGTAFRHGIPVDLPLPLELVWRPITEQTMNPLQRLVELDILAAKQWPSDEYVAPLLHWQQRMLNSFVEGLSNVIPVEVLTIFTGEEIRDAICGNPHVDVELLRRVVEYEGYDPSDEVIQHFWETLREFTNDQRKAFLQFVWARNRLPLKESDFDAPFKIQKDKDSSGTNGEDALPSASTCFFSLTLPKYSTKQQLREKLLFAIENVTTMETDFQTNSAEIAEGYRTF